ncbi:hypothetical protein F383_33809 [Gossypium arboreum]|uniref:Uncharacterized protein n=1 Tax=Gossypium arboreum TaxID=29729 RepID=A0A0B0MXS9_GOSAR|nr:hypothetical protein F383_33809 [Gossypium arboreum]
MEAKTKGKSDFSSPLGNYKEPAGGGDARGMRCEGRARGAGTEAAAVLEAAGNQLRRKGKKP